MSKEQKAVITTAGVPGRSEPYAKLEDGRTMPMGWSWGKTFAVGQTGRASYIRTPNASLWKFTPDEEEVMRDDFANDMVAPRAILTLKRADEADQNIWVTDTVEEATAKVNDCEQYMVTFTRVAGMKLTPFSTQPGNVANIKAAS